MRAAAVLESSLGDHLQAGVFFLRLERVFCTLDKLIKQLLSRKSLLKKC